MVEFDPGPPAEVAEHFARLPTYDQAQQSAFWYDWGPVFHRGRLDRSAKVMVLASDPGPTERIACRTLVGDAGQRVQGFLSKLGVTRSYVCLNAFAYSLIPSRSPSATPWLALPDHLAWRNHLYDMVVGPDLEAVIAFGVQAKRAAALWSSRPDVPLVTVPHPSSRDANRLLQEWRAAVTDLRSVVTPDVDGSAVGPTYGREFRERDYAPIPKRDLPFGLPPWFGDDAWGRTSRPPHRNCVSRGRDKLHRLEWVAPR